MAADGAGSRARPAEGSALSVRHALALARDCGPGFAGDPAASMRQVFAGVRERLGVCAAAEGAWTGDYGATLAVAVLTADVVCVGQVGDTVAVLGCQGRYEAVAPAPRGEYVNETDFVTDSHALSRLRITVRPADEVDAVFLSTDGLRYEILDLATGAAFTPFFADADEHLRAGVDVEAVRRFLATLEDQSGDDKTLVAAVRTEPAADTDPDPDPDAGAGPAAVAGPPR